MINLYKIVKSPILLPSHQLKLYISIKFVWTLLFNSASMTAKRSEMTLKDKKSVLCENSLVTINLIAVGISIFMLMAVANPMNIRMNCCFKRYANISNEFINEYAPVPFVG